MAPDRSIPRPRALSCSRHESQSREVCYSHRISKTVVSEISKPAGKPGMSRFLSCTSIQSCAAGPSRFLTGAFQAEARPSETTRTNEIILSLLG
jgi:hypothetical protein